MKSYRLGLGLFARPHNEAVIRISSKYLLAMRESAILWAKDVMFCQKN